MGPIHRRRTPALWVVVLLVLAVATRMARAFLPSVPSPTTTLAPRLSPTSARVWSILNNAISKPRWRLYGAEDDAMFGLTNLGSPNFGQFGGPNDPHRNLKPKMQDFNAAWKKDESVDFLSELEEVRKRLQGVSLWIVGMPGSGKTTLGKMLAEGLGYRWLDLDVFLEETLGKTATQVFESEGEQAWRKQETKYLMALQTYVQTVVSTGGGVMSVPENMQYLHAGLIIWLDMDADSIHSRMLKSGEIDKRPLLKNADDPKAKLQSLYDQRRPQYALSDVRVQITDSDDPIRVLRRVTHRIIEEMDARPPKVQAWEKKRQQLAKAWQEIRNSGKLPTINPVPDEEKGDEDDPVGLAISRAKAAAGAESSNNKNNGDSSDSNNNNSKKKGDGETGGKGFGTQGKGFGFGLKKGNPNKWV